MLDTYRMSPCLLAIPYAAYSAVLTVSASLAGGTSVGGLLVLHLVAFTAFFLFFLFSPLGREARPVQPAKPRTLASKTLDGIAFLAPIVLFIYLVARQRLPMVESLQSHSFDEIALIREKLLASNTIGEIAVRYVVHGVMPITVLYVYLTRASRWAMFYVFLALALSAVFMFKSFPVIVGSALAYHLFLTRTWSHLAVVALAVFVAVVAQVFAANPNLRSGKSDFATSPRAPSIMLAAATPTTLEAINKASILPFGSSGLKAVSGLWERVVLRPGEGIVAWTSLIPSHIRFTHGCSIRRVARFRGCDYIDLPSQVYALSYPEFVRRGLRGSVNVPHYVEDYSIFGRVGLIISALYVAAGITFAARYFPGVPIAAFLPMMLLLFTSPLHVVIVSEGGIAAALVCVLLRAARANLSSRPPDLLPSRG